MEYQKIINLIDNKIPERIKKFPKNSQQNNWETVTNERNKEIIKKDIYLQKPKPKVPGSSQAASYVHRWALCSISLANV